MALPKKYRLSLNKSSIIGRKYQAPFFSLVVKENTGDKRFAFVIGIKTAKKAVIRNKIRRRLQEAIKEFIPTLKPGDYVFYAKKAILDKNYNQIRDELKIFFTHFNS